jgi:hypothetical protein
METIVFDQWRKRQSGAKASHNGADIRKTSTDNIAIDSDDELRIRRDLPDAKMLNEAIFFMEQKMERYLDYEYDRFRLPNYSLLDGVLCFDVAEKGNHAFEDLKKFHEEKFSELARLRARSHRKNKYLFSIEPGFEIIIPPYDCGWSNRFGSVTAANKTSGTFKSAPLGNSCESSGIGVFLSPTTDVSLRFCAHCPISYSWSNFIGEGGGYAATEGGIGMTIYDASRGAVVKDENEVLWNQSRRPCELELGAGNDDLYFQNTSIGHSYFEMKGGSVYLVWLWCWAFADSGPNAAAYANIDCKVPFMIIDASTV